MTETKPTGPLEPDAPEELLRAAQGGDSEALAKLIEWAAPWLKGQAHRLRSRLGGALEADDAFSTTVRRVLKAPGGVRGEDPEAFKGWLIRILHNALLDEARKVDAVKRRGARDRRWEDLGVLRDPGKGPATRAELDDLREATEAWLAQGDEAWRVLLRTYYLEGASVAEIAEAQGISSEAAHKRLQRARDRMRDALRSGEVRE